MTSKVIEGIMVSNLIKTLGSELMESKDSRPVFIFLESCSNLMTLGRKKKKSVGSYFLSLIPTTMLCGQLTGKPVHKYGQLAVFHWHSHLLAMVLNP